MMVTLSDSIMLLYDKNVQILVNIHVHEKLIVSFTSMVCFFLTIASRHLTCMRTF